MKYLTDKYLTLESLKKAYRSWSKKLHPDLGGSTEEMQILNNEFDYIITNRLFGSFASDKDSKTTTFSSDLAEIIRRIIHIEDITIEIIGCWPWVYGNTFPHKDELKAAGFHFSRQKKMWYYQMTPVFNKRKNTADDLRQMWGSEIVKTPSNHANPASLKA